jgi:hypothetical protein
VPPLAGDGGRQSGGIALRARDSAAPDDGAPSAPPASPAPAAPASPAAPNGAA